MTDFSAPISSQIWDMKYRLKTPEGVPVDQSVDDTWRRVARSLAAAEPEADRAGNNDRRRNVTGKHRQHMLRPKHRRLPQRRRKIRIPHLLAGHTLWIVGHDDPLP